MIKNRLLFIVFFIASSCYIKAEEVNGILIKNNGDTIHQILKIDEKDLKNYLVSNNLVNKLKDFNGKKVSLKRYKSIFFKVKEEAFKFYAINISENDWEESSREKAQFYRLLNNTDAPMKLYEFYDVSDLVGMTVMFGLYYNKKIYRSYLLEKNGVYTVISQNGFISDAKIIFKEDASLLQKIKDKIYTFSDMLTIVNEFNAKQ